MQRCLAARLVLALGAALSANAAQALQFEQVPMSPGSVIIGARGPIVQGDTGRLQRALAALSPAQQLLALALDSPGGSVLEGAQLAAMIREHKWPVVIPSNSKCVSACFLLLASSPRRFAGSDALVGVHSANENGEETDASLAVTTLMARDAADLGIPPAIIGKMVQAPPHRVEWLTPADLESMNVMIYDGDIPLATHQSSVANARPLSLAPAALPRSVPPRSPQAPAISPQTEPSMGFAAGREARRAWDVWLAGLHGAYRDGAVFAQGHFRTPGPISCYGPKGVNRGDFTLGCEIALQRLMQAQVQVQANLDYAAGWDSPDQPPDARMPTAAEYQGAYFCGRQVAHVTLKIFPQTSAPGRRAVFSFGPQPTSPDIPRGAFIVEGSIELDGGALLLTPVKWITRPPDYEWMGLSGRSDDGGKTFSGRVINTRTCTIFTLQRVPGSHEGH